MNIKETSLARPTTFLCTNLFVVTVVSDNTELTVDCSIGATVDGKELDSSFSTVVAIDRPSTGVTVDRDESAVSSSVGVAEDVDV